MNVLLLSPKTPDTFWSFRHALPFISKKAGSPPLGLLTVAALLPRSWNLDLIDLNVSELDDSRILWADYVMISAMLVHQQSARDAARRCRALGRPVIAGGPLFTIRHEAFPEIPHFVLGEAEDLMPELVAHMETGRLKGIYQSDTRPDMKRSPTPRWDLVDFRDYACMPVQFCRGCPYDCEFCDVVVLNGHQPRTKTAEQVITELEALRAAGWKGSLFLVDDNFLGHKPRVRKLLRRMVEWRRTSGARMEFLTEASVDLAEEPEILRLMVEAGFKQVFLGIETPDEDNLKACNKMQNTRRDLGESVAAIQGAGLEVMGGFIIGFDGDKADVFRRQFDFIQKTGVVTAMVGLLTALPGTKLYKRLAAEGRLLGESGGDNTNAECNFRTKLSRRELISGYKRLMHDLYEPNTYYCRARTFLKNLQPSGPGRHIGREEIFAFFRTLWYLGIRHSGRRAYWSFLSHALLHHPRAFGTAITLTIYGHHLRIVSRSL